MKRCVGQGGKVSNCGCKHGHTQFFCDRLRHIDNACHTTTVSSSQKGACKAGNRGSKCNTLSNVNTVADTATGKYWQCRGDLATIADRNGRRYTPVNECGSYGTSLPGSKMFHQLRQHQLQPLLRRLIALPHVLKNPSQPL